MPHGHVTAFFLFEVADAIDLPAVRTAIGATVAARIATRQPTPTYLQYQQPPLTLDAAAIGLDQWKANVREKLKTVDDIYRFAVEHTSMARGEFLEAIVVLLILLEIVLLMK